MNASEMAKYQNEKDIVAIRSCKERFLDAIKSAASCGRGSTTWYRITSGIMYAAKTELERDGYIFIKEYSGWWIFKDYEWRIKWNINTLDHPRNFDNHDLPD